MRVAVLGAGVIGVTSAWRLALTGHEVVIVDQAESVAAGASSANAGMVAPGHSYPWAAPGAPWLLARSLLRRNTRLSIGGRPDADLLRWGARFLRQCGSRPARHNARLALRLSAYSQSLLERWAGEHGIDYDARRGGALYLHHSHREIAAAERRSRLYAPERRQRVLGLAELAAREPALADAGGAGVVGAIFDPADGSGNAAAFTSELARRCRQLGVEILLGQPVEALRRRRGRVTAALLAKAVIEADLFVVSLGAASSQIARTAGERLTLHPVKGYAASFPLRDPRAAPTLPGCDETESVAWSREHDRLRMSTGAVFADRGAAAPADHVEPMLRVGRRLFGSAGDFDRPVLRLGLRSMTPDGIPVIGYGRHNSNLIFNTGQGHVGWTMACGSAQLVDDLVDGREPRLELSPFRVR